MLTEQKQPMAKRVPRDTHVQCYKRSQLLHNHYLQNVGQEQEALRQESLVMPSWLTCSFPTLVPYRKSAEPALKAGRGQGHP